MWLKHIFYGLLPRKCFICQSQVSNDSSLCLDCHSGIKALPDYCQRCCNTIVSGMGCVECAIAPAHDTVDNFILGYPYEDAVREAVVQLKYQHKMYMVPVIEQHASLLNDIDYIIPMPVDRVRLASRGFNHMFEIAKAIQPLINKPILHNALKKRSFTIPQSGLSRRERLKNLHSSFVCAMIEGNVLLLDDVLTTGKTVHHASHAVKSAGASTITTLVLAKA